MDENAKNEVAVFGGGCFWCTEAVFKMLKGINFVLPGYSGGEKPNPSYEEVMRGNTGYVEVIKIGFNPKKISFNDLLTVFFGSHDPTTRNRQGNDIGEQYKSVIFYSSDAQKKEALSFIDEINLSSKEGRPIVTEVLPLKNFYEAENYHKDYYANNSQNPYCEIVINPKLQKVSEKFANLLSANEEK